MKTQIILVLLFIFQHSAFNQKTEQPSSIYNLIHNQKYHNAIILMDDYLTKYPKNAGMYFNRGLALQGINDYLAAYKDFKKAKEIGLPSRLKYINYFTDTAYVVKLIAENYTDYSKLEASNNFKPRTTRIDSLQGALRAERECFDIYYYNLTVRILPRQKSIEGVNQIYFKTISSTKKIQIDLAAQLNIKAILWNGIQLKYEREYNAIFIEFEKPLAENSHQMITIEYEGKPRIAPSPPWNGGFVWKRENFNHWIGVACEHLGASSWWPCKDHLSEKPDSMTINIQVPKGYQAVANGNLKSVKAINKKENNFEWFISYPINSYNVTFYMAKFDHFNEVITTDNSNYNIDYYVLPKNLTIAKKFYSQTKDIVLSYEKLFGPYAYPKDGLAMVESPYAGMEHQGAIAIGGDYGRDKQREYAIKDYNFLVVHETAHEWWGNTVTMDDMADAWLSESFATYAEHLFIEDKYSYSEYIDACAKNMEQIFNIWPMVGPRNVNDNSFLSNDIYRKGAAMLNNFRCEVNNDSLFFAFIKSYYKEHQYQPINTSVFIAYTNQFFNKNYSDFFNKFLYDKEPPILEYDFQLQNDSLIFNYQWTKVGNDFTMPISIMINDSTSIRLDASTQKQTFEIDKVDDFYLPNASKYKKEKVVRNSFTYYWTNWQR